MDLEINDVGASPSQLAVFTLESSLKQKREYLTFL